jgi:hypothetical protein
MAKGNPFATGGAGSPRSGQHGRKRTGCDPSADLVQTGSHEKPDWYPVGREGGAVTLQDIHFRYRLACGQRVHEIA